MDLVQKNNWEVVYEVNLKLQTAFWLISHSSCYFSFCALKEKWQELINQVMLYLLCSAYIPCDVYSYFWLSKFPRGYEFRNTIYLQLRSWAHKNMSKKKTPHYGTLLVYVPAIKILSTHKWTFNGLSNNKALFQFMLLHLYKGHGV